MIKKHGVKSTDIMQYVTYVKKHLHGTKLILFWDGLTAHTSKETRNFIKTQSVWLTVERLPTYAPELNPPEHLWAAMKAKDMGNIEATSMEDLERHIHRSIRRVKTSTSLLLGCLRASGLFQY
jgi:transposase